MKKLAFTLAELSLVFMIMAILAVLFYRILKPEDVVYKHLYYSAYSQFEDAYREVKAYSDDVAPKSVYDASGNFDFNNFVTIFNQTVNFLGNTSAKLKEHKTEGTFDIIEFKDNHYVVEAIPFSEDFATLVNAMRIRFDIFNVTPDDESEAQTILVATIDINGDGAPNEYNKDIIQFEIRKDGFYPIGEIETNSKLLSFNLISKIQDKIETEYGSYTPVSGKEKTIKHGISYQEAACYAYKDLPKRHTYFQTRKCTVNETEINAITYSTSTPIYYCDTKLPCRIDVIKP